MKRGRFKGAEAYVTRVSTRLNSGTDDGVGEDDLRPSLTTLPHLHPSLLHGLPQEMPKISTPRLASLGGGHTRDPSTIHYPRTALERSAYRHPATGRPLTVFQWRLYDAIKEVRPGLLSEVSPSETDESG